MAETAEKKGNEVAVLQPTRLAYHPGWEEAYKLPRTKWRTIVDTIFPSAKTVEGVLMAVQYCHERNLDIMKRPVHVVPIWSTEKKKYVETVWPGIGELRITAQRTQNFAGYGPTTYGERITKEFPVYVKGGGDEQQYDDEAPKQRRTFTLEFYEWCSVSVYRLVRVGGTAEAPVMERFLFEGPKVFWLETYARMGKSITPNDMWQKRANGQLEKCAEAAALRRAFPEEFGAFYVFDEYENQLAGHGPIIDHESEGEHRRQSAAKQFQDFAATGNHKPGGEREPRTIEEVPGQQAGPSVAERRAAKAKQANKAEPEDVSWVDTMRVAMEKASTDTEVSAIWSKHQEQFSAASEATKAIASSVYDECLAVFDSTDDPEGGAAGEGQ